jgi:hypothetical protein
MKLTTQQGYSLLDSHGSYITEVRDACGKGIGAVRFTRKDDPGVWCSRECRGDVQQMHRGGRPKKYRNPQEAQAAKIKLQRLRRNGLNEAKPPSKVTGIKELADSKIASLVVPL